MNCPNHPLPAVTRGLCKRCYVRVAQRVARGLTTWKQLEAEGICAPARPANRPRGVLAMKKVQR